MANLQKCCCLCNYDQPKEPAHIFSYLRQQGLKIGFSDKYFDSVLLDETQAKLLDLPPNSPALKLEDI